MQHGDRRISIDNCYSERPYQGTHLIGIDTFIEPIASPSISIFRQREEIDRIETKQDELSDAEIERVKRRGRDILDGSVGGPPRTNCTIGTSAPQTDQVQGTIVGGQGSGN